MFKYLEGCLQSLEVGGVVEDKLSGRQDGLSMNSVVSLNQSGAGLDGRMPWVAICEA